MTAARKQTFTETIPFGEAVANPSGRRFNAVLIEAGFSLNDRYYSPMLLKRDGVKAFRAGALNFGDHPSEMDRMDRPEGSVRNVLSRLATDAKWDPTVGPMGALVAEVEVFAANTDLLNETYAKAIGLSIRASGTGHEGEVEGRSGLIIDSLSEGGTVDWVTYPGAGGRVLSLLESARPVTEAHGLTNCDLRSSLADALDDAFNATCWWVSIADFDDTSVVFDIRGGDAEGRWQQGYAVDDNQNLTLTGDAVLVNTRTTYVPAAVDPSVAVAEDGDDDTDMAPIDMGEQSRSAPLGASPMKEEPVAESTTQTGAPPAGGATDAPDTNFSEADKAELKRLRGVLAEFEEKAKIKSDAVLRASLAESEVKRLQGENARLLGAEQARQAVAASFAESDLPAPCLASITATVVGLNGSALPITEAGLVDHDRLKATIGSAIEAERLQVAAISEALGYGGRVRGMGAKSGEMSVAELNESLADTFKGLGLTEDKAAVAAKGR